MHLRHRWVPIALLVGCFVIPTAVTEEGAGVPRAGGCSNPPWLSQLRGAAKPSSSTSIPRPPPPPGAWSSNPTPRTRQDRARKGGKRRDPLDYGKWDEILAPPAEDVDAEAVDALVQAGDEARANGDYELSDSLYERALQLNETHCEAAFHRASLLMHHRGRPEAAADLLDRALRVHPDHVGALSLRGSMLAFQKRFSEARPLLERAVRLAPGNPEALNNLGAALAEGGEGADDTARAEACYLRCAEINESYAPALYNHASLLYAKRDPGGAERMYARVLAVQPDNLQAATDYAVMLAGASPGRAGELFKRVLASDPSNARALVGYGSLLARQGDVGGAEGLLRKAIGADSCDVDAMCHLAALAAARGDERGREEARRLYEEGLRLHPGHVGCLCDAAELSRDAGDVDGAREKFEAALALEPGHVPSLRGLGQVLAAIGDASGAEDQYRKALRLRGDDVPSLCCLGALLRDSGSRLEIAEVMFRKALRHEPRHLPSLCHLAMLYGARGDVTEASKLFRAAIDIDPNHVEALCGLASVIADPPSEDEPEVKAEQMMLRMQQQEARLRERLSEAEGLYNRALATQPSFVAALCGLGKVKAMQGMRYEAEETFKQALKVDPNDWQTLTSYGVLLVRQVGDSLNGAHFLDRGLEAAPNDFIAQEVRKLREHTLREGEHEETVLEKGAERMRWEGRWKDLDDANAPYDPKYQAVVNGIK